MVNPKTKSATNKTNSMSPQTKSSPKQSIPTEKIKSQPYTFERDSFNNETDFYGTQDNEDNWGIERGHNQFEPQRFSRGSWPPQRFSRGSGPPQRFSRGSWPPQRFSRGSWPPQRFSRGSWPPQRFSRGSGPPQRFSRGSGPPQRFSRGSWAPQRFSRGYGPPQRFSRGSGPQSFSRGSINQGLDGASLLETSVQFYHNVPAKYTTLKVSLPPWKCDKLALEQMLKLSDDMKLSSGRIVYLQVDRTSVEQILTTLGEFSYEGRKLNVENNEIFEPFRKMIRFQNEGVNLEELQNYLGASSIEQLLSISDYSNCQSIGQLQNRRGNFNYQYYLATFQSKQVIEEFWTKFSFNGDLGHSKSYNKHMLLKRKSNVVTESDEGSAAKKMKTPKGAKATQEVVEEEEEEDEDEDAAEEDDEDEGAAEEDDEDEGAAEEEDEDEGAAEDDDEDATEEDDEDEDTAEEDDEDEDAAEEDDEDAAEEDEGEDAAEEDDDDEDAAEEDDDEEDAAEEDDDDEDAAEEDDDDQGAAEEDDEEDSGDDEEEEEEDD